LTALPLWALVQGGSENKDAIEKGKAFVLSCVRDDGSICREPKEAKKGGGLCNYNTALCMVALNALGDPDLTGIIQKARKFVAEGQHLGSDIYNGGMGYDAETGRPYADLSNTYLAYEAMRLTENVEDLRKAGDPRADLNWEAARQFVSRIQNLPGSNDQAWAQNVADEDRGGFAYKPDSSMAGAVTNEAGEIRLRSYGSMTYAGLLSFIYANVDKNDPRVQSAFQWATAHWNLSENPGMGGQGLYYFLNVLSKGLAAYGTDVITLADGQQVNWREAVIMKLISLQKVDAKSGAGYWVNDEGRWMENDPVLVTSYCVLALEIALGE
jgi:squalene-hopene/tetraprenyl-beta-curcumene cyclase